MIRTTHFFRHIIFFTEFSIQSRARFVRIGIVCPIRSYKSFPSFSSIQDDDEQLRSGYLRSVQGLILAMGPVLAGIFVFAPEIAVLLDKAPILPVLRFLAVATLLKVIGTMVGSMFIAKGKANWSFYWSLFSMAVLIPAMYFYGLPRGVEGVAQVIAAASLLFRFSARTVSLMTRVPMSKFTVSVMTPSCGAVSVMTRLGGAVSVMARDHIDICTAILGCAA